MKTVKAEVIDSVLYDSSDSRSVTFSKPSEGGGVDQEAPLSALSAKWQPSKKLSFTWVGGVGKVTVYFSSSNSKICDSNGNSCNDNGHEPTVIGTQVYAKDENNNTVSATISGP